MRPSRSWPRLAFCLVLGLASAASARVAQRFPDLDADVIRQLGGRVAEDRSLRSPRERPPARRLPPPPPPTPRIDPRVERRVVRAERPSPPISGGTLLALRDGRRVVVADPDRDRVLVADVEAAPAITARIALPSGSEPGRSVEDADGRVHVVLRGTGELLTFHPDRPEERSTRAVCAMPRGVAFDPAASALHVACRSGELVTLPPVGDVARRVVLDRDLRDVVVVGERLWVTRFRSAEVLGVDAAGAVVTRLRPPDVANRTAAVAWRAIALADGDVALLHQYERGDVVGNAALPSTVYYGSPELTTCDSIVSSGITFVRDGAVVPGPQVAGVVLPVDLADGPSGLAVVSAGDQTGVRSLAVAVRTGPSSCSVGATLGSLPHVVAVAYLGDRLVVQQRDPAQLSVLFGGITDRTIALGGASAFDTGHAIFHASTTAGLACASCHPEGGDDGHTWSFSNVGPRRTPALHGTAGTAPFHWTGDLPTFDALVGEVFVRRMGGPELDRAHARALEGWLGHLPAPRSAPATDTAAVERGRAIFEGAGQCSACHSGERHSNGASMDVGTGGSFQVPSLVGVGDRLPLMHGGCAATLAQRFDPACGGDRHGGALDDAQRADLVAYLETL
jgi:mono/diheme cytochrome c family protein